MTDNTITFSKGGHMSDTRNKKLPSPRNWQVWIYVKIQGYSHQQAAEHFDIQKTTVNFHVQEVDRLVDNHQLSNQMRDSMTTLIPEAIAVVQHHLDKNKSLEAAHGLLKELQVYSPRETIRQENKLSISDEEHYKRLNKTLEQEEDELVKQIEEDGFESLSANDVSMLRVIRLEKERKTRLEKKRIKELEEQEQTQVS